MRIPCLYSTSMYICKDNGNEYYSSLPKTPVLIPCQDHSTNLDSVRGDILAPDDPADLGLDLQGRNVLSLPAIRVASPVAEVEPPKVVHLHEVSGPAPPVPLPQDTLHDLLAGGLLVQVAVERAHGVRLRDRGDEFAGLAGLALDAEAGLGIADELTGLLVDLDEAVGEEEGQEPGDEAHRACYSVIIGWKKGI